MNDKSTDKLAIFEDKKMRRIPAGDFWHYSTVDVIAPSMDSKSLIRYRSGLMKKQANCQSYGFIMQLKSKDSKKISQIVLISRDT